MFSKNSPDIESSCQVSRAGGLLTYTYRMIGRFDIKRIRREDGTNTVLVRVGLAVLHCTAFCCFLDMPLQRLVGFSVFSY